MNIIEHNGCGLSKNNRFNLYNEINGSVSENLVNLYVIGSWSIDDFIQNVLNTKYCLFSFRA